MSAAYPWLFRVIKSENKLNKITKTGTKNVTIIELQTEMHKTSGNKHEKKNAFCPQNDL